jgi:aspartyl-tRNA(Asn)/glutamyl-tRNA(Gln) amidotransferase subunit A
LSLPADPAAWTLLEAVEAVAHGAVTSFELTEAALRRAEAAQPRLNAFVAVEAERALGQARAADAARAAGRAGPLNGVPLAHKDMFDRPGRVTGCGSKLRAGEIATKHATVLARLDGAGAVDLGRLNMSEFAMGPTGLNAHHGRARNPWDTERVTGGSSSGSGAAVAGGIVYGALGSDTGGSVRLPAAMCGIAGLKATQGRVSRHGAMPLSFSLDCVGPLAPTVADVAKLYEILAGPDGLDPTVADVPVRLALPRARLDGVTIGVAPAWMEGLDKTTADAHDELRRLLVSLGADIVEVALPTPAELGELSNIVAMTEAAAAHGDYLRLRPEHYGPQVRSRLRQGAAIPGALYLRALAMRTPITERAVAAFGAADAVCLPVTPFLPPLSAEVDGGNLAIPEMVAALARFTRGVNYLGLPALAAPVAWRDGLPVAAQFVGRPFAESAILSYGMAVETALGYGRRINLGIGDTR